MPVKNVNVPSELVAERTERLAPSIALNLNASAGLPWIGTSPSEMPIRQGGPQDSIKPSFLKWSRTW